MSDQTHVVEKFPCPSCGRSYTADFLFPLYCRCGAKCYDDGTFQERRELTDTDRQLLEALQAESQCCDEPDTPRIGGPGTELAKRLYWLAWITGNSKCRRCKRIARLMDRKGCDWCEENIDTLVKWLRKSHTKLNKVARSFVPFVEPLVRQQIMASIEAAKFNALMPYSK